MGHDGGVLGGGRGVGEEHGVALDQGQGAAGGEAGHGGLARPGVLPEEAAPLQQHDGGAGLAAGRGGRGAQHGQTLLVRREAQEERRPRQLPGVEQRRAVRRAVGCRLLRNLKPFIYQPHFPSKR